MINLVWQCFLMNIHVFLILLLLVRQYLENQLEFHQVMKQYILLPSVVAWCSQLIRIIFFFFKSHQAMIKKKTTTNKLINQPAGAQ